MLIRRNHIIILSILLLVSILTGVFMSSNLMGINSQEAMTIKDINVGGGSSTSTASVNVAKCKPPSVNNLNNSIMSFYDTNKRDKSIQSIQTNSVINMNEMMDDGELYILKSQIIPPVCPICPSGIPCKNKIKKKCQPCPPCAKCPEPSFDCKKVPNYSSTRNAYLPRAILTDFSQYGM